MLATRGASFLLKNDYWSAHLNRRPTIARDPFEDGSRSRRRRLAFTAPCSHRSLGGFKHMKSRSGPGHHRFWCHSFFADVATKLHPDLAVTHIVFVNYWRAVWRRPSIPPTRQGDNRRNKIAAHFGEHILVLPFVLFIWTHCHDSSFDKSVQS